ncbi:hypothetical protein PVAND_015337 [Polypedilum vanderplanki]|uniref:Uncharacterized protein n=1 Tax=Polypedilum vanderplanki TaxID=319348 RepID=A0A9J6BCC0_POLVA|nr:hypothetical protein PVAND_015337 [Polypedilum vanderplanki]
MTIKPTTSTTAKLTTKTTTKSSTKTITTEPCNRICPQDCRIMCYYLSSGKCHEFCNSCSANSYACSNKITLVYYYYVMS